jgi:hypothetical protein
VPGECSGGVLDGGDTGESSPTTAFPALVQPFLVFGVPRVRGSSCSGCGGNGCGGAVGGGGGHPVGS